MKTNCLIFLLLLCSTNSHSQFRNHQWLLGNYTQINDPKGRAFIDSSNFFVSTEFRKMAFFGTQGNICDDSGNLIMSSNGVWIANANNDTMLNGGDLNPNAFTNNWLSGLPLPNGNLVLPFPGDTSNYILFHQSANFNGSYYTSDTLYYSIVDMKLDGGMGGVTSKNNPAISDKFSIGIAACKHANGRDWWIVMLQDSSSIIHKLLLTPTGIYPYPNQNLNFSPIPLDNTTQITFSKDGSKLLFTTFDNPQSANTFMTICDFNRCTGLFNNIQTTQIASAIGVFGCAFSSSGNFAYAAATDYIIQVNTNTMTVDTVATYDGFCFPNPPWCTTFFHLYLAADNSIYITSGSSVFYISCIKYPDSAGLMCDVQQHSIFIGNYPHFRSVPNHPNYELGPIIGSSCDTILNLNEIAIEQIDLKIYPNPSNGKFTITYNLPQNQDGLIKISNQLGEIVFSEKLFKWSTVHRLDLDLSKGVYFLKIGNLMRQETKRLIIL